MEFAAFLVGSSCIMIIWMILRSKRGKMSELDKLFKTIRFCIIGAVIILMLLIWGAMVELNDRVDEINRSERVDAINRKCEELCQKTKS